MSNRKDWPIALSQGPSIFEGDGLSRLAASGISRMELSSGSIDPYYALDYPHRAKELYGKAKSAGVTITSIHLPFGPFAKMDPAHPDEAVRAEIVAKQTELLSAAAESGIEIAVLHPSGEPYREEERAERIKIAIDTVGKIAERAAKAGIQLALENLPRTCLCRTHDEMEQFLAAIPTIGVCFDMNHSLKEPNEAYIRAIGSRIVTLHVSDYDFIDERHLLPGRGKNPWPALLAALEDVNYNGRFTYELAWRENETYADVVENYRWLMQ